MAIMKLKWSTFQENYRQFMWSCPVLLAALQLGIQSNWSSPASKRYSETEEDIVLSKSEAKWLGNIVNSGCLFGIVLVVLFLQNASPKSRLWFSTFVMTTSWVLVYFANGFYILLLSRFVGGIGMSSAATIIPSYLGEIASDNHRGKIITLYPLMLVAACPIEFILVPLLGTRISALINAALAVVTFISLLSIPESPYYLVMIKDEVGAKKSLNRLRHGDIYLEFDKIKETVNSRFNSTLNWKQFFKSFKYKNIQMSMIATVIMLSLQIFCLSNVMIIYLHIILEERVHSSISTDMIALWSSILAIFPMLISTALVDTFGIKPLTYISSIACVAVIAILGVFFHCQSLGYNLEGLTWIPISHLIAFKIFQGLGILGIPFKLLGEIFSTEIKSTALCLANFFYFTLLFVTSGLFQIIDEQLGLHFSFYSFGFVSFLIIFLVVYFVPETKNKSLMEIQEILGAKVIKPETINNNNNKNIAITNETFKMRNV